MNTSYWLPIAALLFAGRAVAQEHGHEAEEGGRTGEIRVYVADENRQLVALEDIEATVLVEPKGGKRRMLATTLVKPMGSKKTALGHGGEVSEAGGYHVEFVVIASHGHQADEHDEHGKEEEEHGEEGHGDDDDGGHEAGHGEHESADATPYFHADIDLQAYSCGMEGHALLDAHVECAKCGMTGEPVDLEFSAVVILRIGDETVNAKGFSYPPAVPKSYPEAVARIDEHLKAIEDLINANDLGKVHAVAEKISHICKKLPELAPEHDSAEVARVCQETIALFGEIDDAADNGRKSDAVKVLNAYKAKVSELRKHVEKDGHHD